MSALRVDTAAGAMTIELCPSQAPETCRYFSDIARRGILDDGQVFRVTTDDNDNLSTSSPIHIIQFGTRRGLDESRQVIEHETTDQTGLTHRRWTVSASRYGPGEVYASFFVCMRDEPCLDFGGDRRDDGQGYAAFGRVIDGESLLTSIYARAGVDALLSDPITIHRVIRE
ncbi:MAG: peptidylprolyl isomerase [Xanthomonadales bacterium]|nr:peptidylprolyl isomerase [Xanthomonadales bacterium]